MEDHSGPNLHLSLPAQKIKEVEVRMYDPGVKTRCTGLRCGQCARTALSLFSQR